MHGQSINPSPSRQSKRQQLREIVSRLGESATPSAIREEAYRLGVGIINGHMLIHVRNEVWPDRSKKGGRRAGQEVAPVSSIVCLPNAIPGLARCPSCQSEQSRVRMLWKRVDGTIYRKRLCKDCGELFITTNEPLTRIYARRLQHINAVEKGCTKCNRLLPVSAFGKKACDSELYRSRCKECEQLCRRVGYGKRGIEKTYGITLQQYEQMVQVQNQVCAICKQPESGIRRNKKLPFCVDHCHGTGKIRGLLCIRCNLAIGNFDDDVDRLRAAIDYLTRDEPGTSNKEGGPSCR